MSQLKTHFWGWDGPVLQKAVAELTRDWRGGELDLSTLLIVVPTMEVSRRLREALAVEADKRESAVTAPRVWHPEQALLAGWEGDEIASRLEERVAWMQVLEGLEVADYPALFPVVPSSTGAVWAATIAEMLSSLRKTLGGGGHDLKSVAKVMRGREDEERWSDLARLEQRYLDQLQQVSMADAQQAKQSMAQHPPVPEGVRRVLVFAAPDLTRLMQHWLKKLAQSVPVHVFVHAPKERMAQFDEFGTPNAKAWTTAPSRGLPVTDDMIKLAITPEDQARDVVAALRSFAGAGLTAAAGACDPLLNPHLESELAAEGVVAYDPSGRLAEQHSLVDVLRCWLTLMDSRAWKPFAVMLRRHDVLSALAKAHDLPAAAMLNDADAMHESALPTTIEDAKVLGDPEKFIGLRNILDDVSRQLDEWKTGSAAKLRGLLMRLYGQREFDTEHDHDRGLVEILGEVMGTAEALDKALAGRELDGSTWLSLLLAEVSQTNLTDRRGEADLVLHGWLELLWEPAAGLAIAAFNDEHVPGLVTPDPFLPDPLRQELGLTCAESRQARDAYLLTAMIEQRKQAGALRLIVGRQSDDSDVLRPSRLLFAGDDATLVRRIHQLFPKHDGKTGSEPRPSRSVAWKLVPPKPAVALKHVSPSVLSAYLKCPLRCYFSHVLRMNEVDSSIREMGNDAFGRLVHEVWRRFAADKDLTGSANEELIANYLMKTADVVARERYGDRPLFSVTMQIESAKQRLRALAATQQKLRQEGWRIEHAEYLVKPEEGLTIAGVPFKGQIDRVDRHETTGRLRVWDYKTGKQGDPMKDHLEKVQLEAGDELGVEWRALEMDGGNATAWKNLQLPLYVWAMQQKHPGVEIEAGYLHLPAVVSGTREYLWEGLNQDMIDSAHQCAEAAVRRMLGGVFWPPQEVKYDDWGELFMGDALEAVAPIESWKEAAA